MLLYEMLLFLDIRETPFNQTSFFGINSQGYILKVGYHLNIVTLQLLYQFYLSVAVWFISTVTLFCIYCIGDRGFQFLIIHIDQYELF